MKKILILLFYWLTLIFIHYLSSDISLSVVSKSYDNIVFHQFKTTELLAKQKISGEFKASYNNLGIVLIPFNTYQRNNQDFLVFRIKEKDSGNWHYQAQYDALQFIDKEYYPFGFSVINNSAGKNYEFEIESTLGTPGNSVAISLQRPVIMTKYQYPKNEIITLAYNKFISAVENNNLVFASLVFFTPLLIYLLKRNLTADFIILPLIIYDLIFVKSIYDLVILTLVIDIIILFKKSFILALIFLFFSFTFNIVQLNIMAEKSAIYAFILLTTGTISSIINLYL